MMLVLRADITEQPVAVAELESLVAHEAAGAVVGFAGVILVEASPSFRATTVRLSSRMSKGGATSSS